MKGWRVAGHYANMGRRYIPCNGTAGPPFGHLRAPPKWLLRGATARRGGALRRRLEPPAGRAQGLQCGGSMVVLALDHVESLRNIIILNSHAVTS